LSKTAVAAPKSEVLKAAAVVSKVVAAAPKTVTVAVTVKIAAATPKTAAAAMVPKAAPVVAAPRAGAVALKSVSAGEKSRGKKPSKKDLTLRKAAKQSKLFVALASILSSSQRCDIPASPAPDADDDN
jgi:hypothetical protein